MDGVCAYTEDGDVEGEKRHLSAYSK